ncbi:MAG: cupin domain-containing protein [Deltaproteobacteria bacterium]|nr:cupin domain-containing protein [Deltaproteobacteria bacterium]
MSEATATWNGQERRRAACTFVHENKNLRRLKELSSQLPDLSKLLSGKSAPGKPEYVTVKHNGSETTSTGTTLLAEDGVGCMRLRMHAGETFNPHRHDEVEWIVVVAGSFVTIIDGAEHKIGTGQAICYSTGQVHYGTALEDLDCICISIPRAAGYPDGK